MGLWILACSLYLYFVVYWHLQARKATREARWPRVSYCMEWRDRLLIIGAVAGTATSIIVSL